MQFTPQQMELYSILLRTYEMCKLMISANYTPLAKELEFLNAHECSLMQAIEYVLFFIAESFVTFVDKPQDTLILQSLLNYDKSTPFLNCLSRMTEKSMDIFVHFINVAYAFSNLLQNGESRLQIKETITSNEEYIKMKIYFLKWITNNSCAYNTFLHIPNLSIDIGSFTIHR